MHKSAPFYGGSKLLSVESLGEAPKNIPSEVNSLT
jgi:hypothetical protein